MSTGTKVFYLLLVIAAIFYLPYLGSWLHYEGEFPDHFFAYPMLEPFEKPAFNPIIFWALVGGMVLVASLYLFPFLFGFKKGEYPEEKPADKVNFPVWFWAGLAMWGIPLILLFSRASEPKWLLYWSDLPIFWGFTLLLDGIVYKRRGGVSIIASSPREILGIGAASILGWMIFEYLNFFVDDNWYYPFGNLVPQNEFLLYAIVGSSGLMPMAFEWYSLLRTFKGMRHRFDRGWKIVLPEWLKTGALILALGGMVASGLFPNGFFFSLWISPLVIIAVVLDKLDIWTPFRSIGTGNWTPLLLFAITYFFQGITMEGWNYLSGAHAGGEVVLTYAPAYWVYSIPYIEGPRIFEMPLVGYLGYIPFSLYCWVWWILFAYLLDIPTRFAKLEAAGN